MQTIYAFWSTSFRFHFVLFYHNFIYCFNFFCWYFFFLSLHGVIHSFHLVTTLFSFFRTYSWFLSNTTFRQNRLFLMGVSPFEMMAARSFLIPAVAIRHKKSNSRCSCFRPLFSFVFTELRDSSNEQAFKYIFNAL
jgi:hypothetical protein